MRLELIAATTFGLEAVVRREIEALGYEIVKTEDGKVTFLGDERAVVRTNLWLRSADRIQLKMAEFPCETSEELFQTVKGLPWEELIPFDGKFTVNVSTVKSLLRSEPINQKTVKKAIVERMGDTYGVDHFPETGAAYTVKLNLKKDVATITVDTTGESLHKRGYRTNDVAAPIKETMAAAMLTLSFWRPGRTLVDPCAGSGTIPIEAAMIGRNIAPGLSRHFASEEWEFIPKEMWKEEREKAYKAIDYDAPLDILAADLDPRAFEAMQENADNAGVLEDIQFACQDIETSLLGDGSPEDVAFLPDHGVIVMNPPYGERIGDQEGIDHIYACLEDFLLERPDYSLFLITSDKGFEKYGIHRRADRRRKLYNGRLQVTYYQFHGKRPERMD